MCLRNVLTIIDGEGPHAQRVFDAGVELAERERARLTLVKPCVTTRVFVWFSPCTIGGICVPPDLDPKLDASRALARAVEFVPAHIPVTTLVLAADTRAQLCRLLHDGAFDAVVGPESLLRRGRRLRRELKRLGVRVVPIGRHSDQTIPARWTDSPAPATPLTVT